MGAPCCRSAPDTGRERGLEREGWGYCPRNYGQQCLRTEPNSTWENISLSLRCWQMGKHEMRKLITEVEEKLSGITLTTTAPPLSVKQKAVSPRFKTDTEQLKDQDLSGIHGTQEVSVRGDQKLLTERKMPASGCYLQSCWCSSAHWCFRTGVTCESPLKNLFMPIPEMLLRGQNSSSYFAILSHRAAAGILCCNQQLVCSDLSAAFCTWNAWILS